MKENKPGPGPVISELADYIAAAQARPLPAEVAEKTGLHLLDTLAAMVSGSALHPGEIAVEYVRGLGGTEESVVIGSDVVTTAVNAALANGMAAHADETDDSHMSSRSHLGVCRMTGFSYAIASRRGLRRTKRPIPRARTALQDHASPQCSIVLPSSVVGRSHLGNPG